MFNTPTQAIIVFIIVCTILLLLLISMMLIFIYNYQQKKNIYLKKLEELKILHQNALLQSQLEIQEQTFQNISREIHDNIGQKLTLAKLHLNMLDRNNLNGQNHKVSSAIEMIGEAINDLSDLSRSMSSELILQNGLIKALEFEVAQLTKLGLYEINVHITGITIFLEANKELVLFRIVQEALNNILKHSLATIIDISVNFDNNNLCLQIQDNGSGFSNGDHAEAGIGLKNMCKRAKMLNGNCIISSLPERGTIINIKIPIYE